MKTLLQFALATLAKLDLATVRRVWSTIENLVPGLEAVSSKTGQEKAQFVVERVQTLIPLNRTDVATQVIRAVIELVLISLRLKGGGG